jgi:hypothetical protein
MARANLQVDAALTAAFEAACTNATPVRVLRASIVGERIVGGPETAASGSAEEDFLGMASEKVSPQFYIWNNEPCTFSPRLLYDLAVGG